MCHLPTQISFFPHSSQYSLSLRIFAPQNRQNFVWVSSAAGAASVTRGWDTLSGTVWDDKIERLEEQRNKMVHRGVMEATPEDAYSLALDQKAAQKEGKNHPSAAYIIHSKGQEQQATLYPGRRRQLRGRTRLNA
jgi:hypothetical protein